MPGNLGTAGFTAFKVHKIQRVAKGLQRTVQFRVEPRLPRLHAGAGTPLTLAQIEVIGDVVDGLDAHFLQCLFRARVESWQIANVVIRKRRIATVVELARDGMGAMRSRFDVRRCGHRQNCECRPKLECQFRLQLGYLPCDVSNAKETPRIDAAALRTHNSGSRAPDSRNQRPTHSERAHDIESPRHQGALPSWKCST